MEFVLETPRIYFKSIITLMRTILDYCEMTREVSYHELTKNLEEYS